MIDSLQYITQNHPDFTHAQLCERACESGVKWIQLRMKGASESIYLNEALKCREITLKYNAKLIINDNVKIAKQVSADGIHVGLEDLPVKEVRSLLGNKVIIGGTANTFSDVIKHVEEGADYIGVGPFKFTETKKNLSPILGLKGYGLIVENMEMNNIKIPVIAVGGIDESDVSAIRNLGIHGIAVSGLISYSKYQEALIKRLKTYLI